MYGLNKNAMAAINRILVLKIIYQEKLVSKKQLSQKLNLSIPTISKIIKSLEEKGYLSSTGKLANVSGQHQGYWMISPQKDIYLCISVSPSEVKFLVVDAQLSHLSELKILNTDLKNFSDITQLVIEYVHKYQEEFPHITKVAIICHGIIDYLKGSSQFMPRLETKEIYPLKDELQKSISIPMKIDNSCNIYALGEKWLGEGMKYDNFVWVNLDKGIGSAIVFNNEMYRGKNYTAGELGHIEIVKDGLPCLCGNRGCLESYASTSYILQQWKKIQPSANSLDGFFEAIHQQEQSALDLLEEIISYLKKGIEPIIALLNPQHVFLGGELTKAKQTLLNNLRDSIYSSPIHNSHNKEDMSITNLSDQDLLACGTFLWIEDELALDK